MEPQIASLNVTPSDLMNMVAKAVGFYSAPYGNTLSHEDIEDAVMSVISKAIAAAADYDPEKGSLSTWLGRISHNVVMSELSRNIRRRQLFSYSSTRNQSEDRQPLSIISHHDSPDSAIRSREAERSVMESVRTDRDRKILMMRAQGYDSMEIAQALSITPSTVYLVVHKAKSRLINAA